MVRKCWGGKASTISKIRSARAVEAYVRQVASGWSDYLGEGESVPLFWAGQGAGAVGLVGEVGVGELERLLEGRDPERLGDRDAARVAHPRRSTMGWELSWAPPKSASALWAVGSDEMARAVEEAMVAATGEALRVWEGAVWARQAGGWVHTDGMLAARASGTTNRNGDPQLHHHVVIANLARRRTDGRWRALDGQLLWPGRSWATQVWGRTFRRELSRRTGLRWGPANSRGDRELAAVPAELVELWSSRDREIDEEQARLEDELGKPVGKAARLIISARTRQHKDLAEHMGQRRQRWRSEAEACVPGVVDQLQGLGTGPASLPVSRWTAPSLAAAVAAELSERRAVWDGDEWLRTTARVAGDRVGTEVLEEWSAEALRDAGGKASPVLALQPVRQGRHVPEAGVLFRPGGERWTTVENRRREELGWDWFHNPDKKARNRRWTVPTTTAQAVAILEGLDPEQTEAVVGWASGDARGGILIGPGGTGKTTTLGGIAAVARAEGIPVRAMAVSQGATKEAGTAVGNPAAVNIARFLTATQDRHQWGELEGGWWIVDEASMVTSAHWAGIIERAEAAGAAILAVGDPAQIGPVRSASLFGTVLSTDAARWELTTVWRIEDEWEQAASLQLRARDPHGVDRYHTEERIVGYPSRGELNEAVAGWIIGAETRGADVLVSVATNREADDLNTAVQNLLARDRDPDAAELVLHWTERATGDKQTRRIGVGDVVRTRRNDWGQHTSTSNGQPVLNGDVWRVTGIETGRITARSVDKTRRRRVATFGVAYVAGRDPDTGRPWVEHGWVSTAHSVQGRTTDAAVAIVGPASKAETLYVAASRGRRNWIVGVGTPDEVAETAKAALGRIGRQPTALDHGIRSQGAAQAWADVLPPGLAAAHIKQRAIQSGLTVDQADRTARRYTQQQLTRARDWVRAQEPHQNPQGLGEAAVRNWCLSPELAAPFADLYTAQEQKRIQERVAAEREQINRARQTQAARWEKVHNIERGLADQRRELAHREETLLHQQGNIDTEEQQRGRLSRRLGARQRAAEKQRIADELQQIEAERQPINHAEQHIRRWRKTEQERKKPIEAWVRELPEGLDDDTTHRRIVEQWGLGPNAAEAVDQWETVESERARTKEIHQWWQGLADGLTYAQVRAEAAQRWGPDDAAVLADDYRRRQTRRATAWVRSRQAGFPPESVAAAARERFGIGDHPDDGLAAVYQAVAEQRTQKASAWLGLNDDWDTTETDQAATIAGFGLRPRYAEWLVANHRLAAIKAWVNNNLADDLPTHQAHQRITEQWGEGRYADPVLAEWERTQQQRQQAQQEQQRQDRGRGGLSL